MIKNAYSITVTGKLHYSPVDPPRAPGLYVMQRTGAGFGNVTGSSGKSEQVRVWVHGTDPATAKQRGRRSAFAAAVLAWQSLTPSEKADAKRAGAALGLPGYHWYIRNYLRTVAVPSSASLWVSRWDGGATGWDGGASRWLSRWDGNSSTWDITL